MSSQSKIPLPPTLSTPRTQTNRRKDPIWSTNGRMGRKDYIICLLIGLCIAITSFIVIITENPLASILFLIIFYLWCILYGIIFTVKRLHDMGYSGYWWFLIYFINFITFGYTSIIITILLCCIPGTEGENKYGDIHLSIFSRNNS